MTSKSATLSDKPITFTSRLAPKVWSGEKTETRRIVTPRIKGARVAWITEGGRVTEVLNADEDGDPMDAPAIKNPFEPTGRVLWIRETFAFGRGYDADPEQGIPHVPPRDVPAGVNVWYMAPGPLARPKHLPWDARCSGRKAWDAPGRGKTRSARFMPRRFSRGSIVVLETWAESLSAITDDGALAEGIEPGPLARERFLAGWDELHKGDREKQSAADPLVWVVRFELAETGVKP